MARSQVLYHRWSSLSWLLLPFPLLPFTPTSMPPSLPRPQPAQYMPACLPACLPTYMRTCVLVGRMQEKCGGAMRIDREFVDLALSLVRMVRPSWDACRCIHRRDRVS
eukprot:GHVU01117701.1.p3 GENE.GHVU01117701.1~~GHVU01117701.1.p3  ORF type:complete len:108 (+),score=0.79 GHVU01117701.1:44-367(+)